jgi:hypothetical protein
MNVQYSIFQGVPVTKYNTHCSKFRKIGNVYNLENFTRIVLKNFHTRYSKQ